MEMIGRVIEKKRNRPGVTALHFTVTVASLGPRHLRSQFSALTSTFVLDTLV